MDKHESCNFSAEQLLELLEITKIGTWDWDLQTNTVIYSEGLLELLGYDSIIMPVNRVILEEIVHPEDLYYSNEQLNKHLRGETSFYEAELRLTRRDGSMIWARDKGKITEYDDDGNPVRVIGLLQDITNAKETEATLKENSVSLGLAVSAAGIALWDWDIVNNCVTHSPEFYKLLGYRKENLKGTLEESQKCCHPDDLDHNMAMLNDVLSGKIDSYESEIRLKHKYGHYIWTRSFGTVIERDINGKPTRVMGGQLNINSLKTSQERLTEALDELEQNKLLLEHEVDIRTKALVEQENMLWTINSIAQKLLAFNNECNFDVLINDCLKQLGESSGRERISICKNKIIDGKFCYTPLYQWSTIKITEKFYKIFVEQDYDSIVPNVLNSVGATSETKWKNVVSNIVNNVKCYEETLPTFSSMFETGKSINCAVKDLTVLEQMYFGFQGIKSVLATPIFLNGKPWGFVGVVNCETGELFSEVEVKMIGIGGFTLASAIEKSETNSKIHEMEVRNELMLNATPLCCGLWTKELNHMACNDAAVRLFGLSSQQEYLDRFFELSPEVQPCGSNSKELWNENLETAFQNEFFKFEWTHQDLNGELIPSEITLVRIKHRNDYIVANYTRDLREIKASEASMRAAEELNELMINATPIGCQLWDRDFNIIACNDALVRLFGLSSQKDFKKKFFELSPKYQPCGRKSMALAFEYLKKAYVDGSCKFEWTHISSSGEIIPTEITLVRMKHKNDYILAGYTRDLRELNAMLEELHKTEKDLITARDEALLSSKAKSNFLANMSHEIRTPMNAISGLAEIILRESRGRQVADYAVGIKNACDSLLNIINDILDISKIESGKLRIVISEYNMASMLNDVISISRLRLGEKPVMFITNIDSNLPAKLLGDELRIKQILLNILSNAIKFTHQGHITLDISGSIDGNITELKFKVIDTGVGIKEKDIEQLFEEFEQFNTTKNRSIEGTGLGLAISKQLCEMMNGYIEVESVYGKGSTFTVTIQQECINYIPLASVTAKKSVLVYEPREPYYDSICNTINNLGCESTLCSNQSELYENINEKSFDYVITSPLHVKKVKAIIKKQQLNISIIALANYGENLMQNDIYTIFLPFNCIQIADLFNNESKSEYLNQNLATPLGFTAPEAKILLVDDNPVNLKVAVGLMTPYKFDIDTAVNGIEAVEKVKHNYYDLVLMDHMMPEMDGIDATAAIRSFEEEYFKNLPIIALTANALVGTREMFIKEGMNDFLAKPIEMSKLNSVLSKWIPKEKQYFDSQDIQFSSYHNEIEIEGVNTLQGIAAVGGNFDNYFQILSVYYMDIQKKCATLPNHYHKGDISSFRAEVHALKSASATIGANELASKAARLESAALKGDMAFIEKNIDVFLRLLQELTEAIKPYAGLGSKNDNSYQNSQRETGSKEYLKEMLDILYNAVEFVNINQIEDTINKLAEFEWQQEITDELNSFREYISVFDYDEALICVQKLQKM